MQKTLFEEAADSLRRKEGRKKEGRKKEGRKEGRSTHSVIMGHFWLSLAAALAALGAAESGAITNIVFPGKTNGDSLGSGSRRPPAAATTTKDVREPGREKCKLSEASGGGRLSAQYQPLVMGSHDSDFKDSSLLANFIDLRQ